MDGVVLPLKRGKLAAQVAGCAAVTVVFGATGVLILVPGYWPAFDAALSRDEVADGTLLILCALSAAAVGVFSYFFGARLRNLLQSPGLHITSVGFDYGRYTWAWADIDGFATAHPLIGGPSVRVIYKHGTEPTIRAKVSCALARKGFSTGSLPTFLPLLFETGPRSLEEVMLDWLARYRTGWFD